MVCPLIQSCNNCFFSSIKRFKYRKYGEWLEYVVMFPKMYYFEALLKDFVIFLSQGKAPKCES